MPEADANDLVLVERHDAVALLRLNRPAVRNALNSALIVRLSSELYVLDDDATVHAVVLTGNDRAFAAGADIAEMAGMDMVDMHLGPRLGLWERMRKLRKPLIAAVNGFALGGGNELAMLCDMVIAGEDARFGQPEINLGIIPGGGGTQRLVRAVGKARAMELILTGRMMSADEAFAAGLVTKVVPAELCLSEAIRLAELVASKPPLAVQVAKDCVNKAFDTTLETGLEFERRSFNLLFGTKDRQEGMAAFLEKRRPEFTGR
jgi:enoyl-CoA hydratase